MLFTSRWQKLLEPHKLGTNWLCKYHVTVNLSSTLPPSVSALPPSPLSVSLPGDIDVDPPMESGEDSGEESDASDECVVEEDQDFDLDN